LQESPFGHFCAQVPPQSTPVSAPFFTLSAQDGATQEPLGQLAEAQSVPDWQSLPTTHLGHEPPQSTSDSLPFFAWSPQDADWQTPFGQTPVVQSDAAAQDWPGVQSPQSGPPQSSSVSRPFLV
jgi:hypothetical protein